MILAGVVVATVTSNNGILSKSKLARDIYQNSANKEKSILSKYENEIDKTALDVASSREQTINSNSLLWSGHYNTSIDSNAKQTTGGIGLNSGHNIEEYNFLLILCECTNIATPNYCSTLFPVDIIKNNYGYPTIEICTYANSSFYSRIDLGFINNSKFYIAWKSLSGWTTQNVTHIYGIK